MKDMLDAEICEKAGGKWDARTKMCNVRKNSIYKIVEVYPQSTVRLVHYVLVKTKKDLEDAKLYPGEMSFETKTDIDYGSEAYTESTINLTAKRK